MKKLTSYLFALFLITLACSDDKQEPEVILRYDLTTEVTPNGSGTISPSTGSYNEGQNITLTAKPNEGFTFKNWSGSATGTELTTTVTMSGHKKVTANFEENVAAPQFEDISVIELEDHSDFDYLVVFKESSDYLMVKTSESDPDSPENVLFYNSKSEEYISLFYNDLGQIKKMVSGDQIVLLDNFNGNHLDAAVINSNGDIEITRNIETNFNWENDTWQKNYAAKSLGISSWLKAISLNIDAASCMVAFVKLDALGAFNCGLGIGERIGNYLRDNDIFKIEVSQEFIDNIDSFFDVYDAVSLGVGCATLNFDCFLTFLGFINSHALKPINELLDERDETINEVQSCLEDESKCSNQVGIECEDLMISNEMYSETDDLDQKIIQEFGDSYSMADWNDIKNMSNLNDWISCMKINHDQTFMVKKDGSNFYGSDRQYYVHYSTDGVPYSGFLVHDRVGDFYLGSWYGLNMNVLSEKSDPNAQTFLEKYDGVVWKNTIGGSSGSLYYTKLSNGGNSDIFWEFYHNELGCYEYYNNLRDLDDGWKREIEKNTEDTFIYKEYLSGSSSYTLVSFTVVNETLREEYKDYTNGELTSSDEAWHYEKTSVNVNNFDLCDDGGNVFTTEFFNLNDNQVPDGWQFETIKNADLSNGRMNAYPNDGIATMIKVGEVSSSTQEIILEMDGNIAYSYWGLYSSFKITAGDKNLSFHSGEQDYEWPANQLANFVTYNDGQNGSRIYESLTPSVPGTYHFKLIMNSSGYELIGTDPNGEEAYRTKINSNDYFDFREIDKIEFLVISHTDNDGWIDNLRVTVN